MSHPSHIWNINTHAASLTLLQVTVYKCSLPIAIGGVAWAWIIGWSALYLKPDRKIRWPTVLTRKCECLKTAFPVVRGCDLLSISGKSNLFLGSLSLLKAHLSRSMLSPLSQFVIFLTKVTVFFSGEHTKEPSNWFIINARNDIYVDILRVLTYSVLCPWQWRQAHWLNIWMPYLCTFHIIPAHEVDKDPRHCLSCSCWIRLRWCHMRVPHNHDNQWLWVLEL